MARVDPQPEASRAEPPLISVVTPFLNGRRFMEDAIESVLAQTLTSFELLLIDDGSIDGSSSLARDYATRFPQQIRYFEHPGHTNRGKSVSRNLGIANARGLYLTFLDADDVFLPRKLESQAQLLARYPQAVMVYGTTEYWVSWDTEQTESAKEPAHQVPDHKEPAHKEPAGEEPARTGDSRGLLGLPSLRAFSRDWRDRLGVTAERARNPDWHGRLGVTPERLYSPPDLLVAYLRDPGIVPCICGLLARTAEVKLTGAFDEHIQDLFEDQIFLVKMLMSGPVYVESGCGERYRQHPDSSSALAVASGQYHPLRANPARLAYLEWLQRYLQGHGLMSENLRRALSAAFRPYHYPKAYSALHSFRALVSRRK
ncbi:MAG: glycosyltransferase family 2 protein [Steroidobacteraceae bacterium]